MRISIGISIRPDWSPQKVEASAVGMALLTVLSRHRRTALWRTNCAATLDNFARHAAGGAARTPVAQQLLTLCESDLALLLAGKGRARMVWDMLREGRDPVREAGAIVAGEIAGRDARPSALEMMSSARLSAGGERLGLTAKTARMLLDAGAALPLARVKQHVTAACGTHKLLIELEHGAQVETVLIPSQEHSVSKRKRTTLCVSSQSGCARGCIFCATGKLGLLRNLTASEILAQVFLATRLAREEGLPGVQNVVFMGEGEPLNNMRHVSKAVELMTSPGGFMLSPRKVTVSTVGPSPSHIRRIAALPAAVAWSLHAADDDIRKRLVPTQRWHVHDLRDAFVDVLAQRGPGHHLFVEATLLRGINDSLEDAEKMAKILEPFRAGVADAPKVNLLAYNDNGVSGLACSSDEVMRAFRDRLMREGYVCTLRRARGTPQSAACGQLSGAARPASARRKTVNVKGTHPVAAEERSR